MAPHQITNKEYENFPDDIYICGIFLLSVGAHLANVTNELYEGVSTLSMVAYFGQETSTIFHASIVNTYNDILKSSPGVINAIGENLIAWISDPTPERIKKLGDLYNFLKKNLR